MDKRSELSSIGVERFLATLDNMLEGFQIIGRDWRYLYVNNCVAKQGGRSKGGLLGLKMWEAYPGIESSEVFAVLKRSMEERIEQHVENEFAYPDGSKKWFELSIQPVPEGLLILSIDITGRKRAEELSQRTVEQLRLIAENVDDLISVLELDGKRIYSSPSFESILGPPDSLYGTDSFQEIHPEDRERVKSTITETSQSGVGQRNEYRLMAKDGSIRFVESQITTIRDEQGKIRRILVVSRDVTERKQLERQFLRLERMESVGTLAAGVAHDLNNVLAPILLALDVLRQRLPDEGSQKMFTMLEAMVGRGSGLIKQMLSFARGAEGEHVAIQVGHVIDEIGKMITETFPKTITLLLDVSANLPAVAGDPTQLHQVLMNLCVNARDAMPNGGKLELKAENITLDAQYVRMHVEASPGPYIVITVTDQGTGIPPGVIERIFDPFFTTKEVGKGTGLGLSTVLGIVKSHNGFVNVYSEVGRGTTFKVYLPAREIAQEATREEKEDIPMGTGELILVVDDEASIREITRTTLESHNYSVIVAADGTEAVAAYATHQTRIAVVITDMVMPFLDGMATSRAIQKMNPKAKIIAVSGQKQDESRLKQLGITFLNKPYTSETLLKAVHEVRTNRPEGFGRREDRLGARGFERSSR